MFIALAPHVTNTTKNYKAKLQLQKSCQKHFHMKKGDPKMLMEMIPVVNFINIV
jgi:hypothetical protein